VLYDRSIVAIRRTAWAARTFAYHAARNALARTSPRAFSALQRLTRDTGRGDECSGAAAADYFEAVVSDYSVIAEASGIAPRGTLFAGRRVLELGPGDTRAVALLARIEGAAAWEGYDAFDIQSRDARYLEAIYAPLVARRGAARDRDWLDGCRMHTSASSLRRAGRRFDVVVSRAVLEHVRGLRGLFREVADVIHDDAVLIHKVDLRSHGIEHRHALDFLRFGERAWRAMSSHVDLPNRERASSYLTLAEDTGLSTIWARTTHVIDARAASSVARGLAPPFRAVPTEELRVLGLWLVQVGPRHPLAGRPLGALEPAPHERLSRH